MKSLLIDLEEGSYFLECVKLQAKTIEDLGEIAKAIREKTKELGHPPYERIVLDNGTVLEDIVKPLALKLYRETPMGKNYDGDILKLPNGAGYLYAREAFLRVIQMFSELAPYFILICHTADKLIDKEGKEMSEMSIDLTGKLARLIAARADAVGYVYRDKNKTIMSFKSGENTTAAARAPHLWEKDIVIAESGEDGKINAYWDLIYKKDE